MPYHHGSLAKELICATLDLIAERGINEFSVAEVARRVGVSTAAPYRHFTDRRALLAAAGDAAATELSDRITTAIADHSAAEDKIAATTRVYTRFVAERGAGLDVIFAPGRDTGDCFAETRGLMDLLLTVCCGATGDPAEGLVLLERVMAIAHGYATLYRNGPISLGLTELATVVEKSGETARVLARQSSLYP